MLGLFQRFDIKRIVSPTKSVPQAILNDTILKRG